MVEDRKVHAISNRSLLHEPLMRRIAQRIIRTPDDKLCSITFTESALCRQHNVSRTVVREAVKILAAKGLLDIRPKRGIRVNPKSKWHLTDPHILTWLSEGTPNRQFIRDLCEVRLVLEPAAAALAAIRATNQEIEDILKWNARMERTRLHTKKFVDADLRFHAAIFGACHNDLMEELTSKLRKAFRASIAITSQTRHGLKPALYLHQKVAEAIAQRNPHMARSRMEELLSRTNADLAELLKGIRPVNPPSAVEVSA